jgi:WD40 repeat protein
MTRGAQRLAGSLRSNDHNDQGILVRPFIALSNELFAKILASCPLNNSNTGELIKSLIGHENNVISLVLWNDAHMASSSIDRTIKIWDLASGQLGDSFKKVFGRPEPYKSPGRSWPMIDPDRS